MIVDGNVDNKMYAVLQFAAVLGDRTERLMLLAKLM
jgi:hypothetical protein